MRLSQFALAFLCALMLASCRGGDDKPIVTGGSSLTAPLNLTANVGTNAISLGWDAPANNGGSPIQSYDVEVTPAITSSNIVINGTRALLQNLAAGTAYTVTVRARNGTGLGPAASTITATTQTPANISYQPLTISGDNSPSGIFDPSVIRGTAAGELWMAYSSVNYYNNASAQLVQDVGIRIARSTDSGASFTYQTTIATPSDVTLASCGLANCQGRWVYETSFLIDDSTDPNPARRYKLFAHKYFLKPGNVPATLYHLGSIVMWTAPSPSGTWSSETSLLGWNLTPAELAPLRVVNGLHADLTPCLVVSEGSASVRGGSIDFAFACPYTSGSGNLQKIVMVRSADHANTFQYVSTLLTAADAAPIGANYFTAPALLATAGTAPVLLVTPTYGSVYTGCIAIPIADDVNGTLFRVSGLPVGILYTPPQTTGAAISGACTYDINLGTRGILQSNTIAGAAPFAIFATQARLQLQ